jgi:hypothetical protein
MARRPQHGTIHDSVYNAFSFGLFAGCELELEDAKTLGMSQQEPELQELEKT